MGIVNLSPYKEFYNTACKVIQEMDGPKVLIVTVQPFGFLKLGYLIHQKTGIKWIADYRDDWTTTELFVEGKTKQFLTQYYYPNLEKKWTSSANLITSVSQHYVNKVLSFLNHKDLKGLMIQNGFFEEEFKNLPRFKPRECTISFVYIGSLYSTQNVDIILKALNQALQINYIPKQVIFTFLGTAMLSQKKEFLSKKYQNVNIEFYERLPKMESLHILRQHNYGIMSPHKNLKGIPSSKLYEFLGVRIPVIYFPNDHDIIHETLEECKLGFTASNYNDLVSLFVKILKSNFSIERLACDQINKFTRRQSTKLLVERILAL